MGRKRVAYECEVLGCNEPFHSRFGEAETELCKKHYQREYMKEKYRSKTCEVSRCGQDKVVEREGRGHCRFHHNLLFHTPDSPMYRSKEFCGCLEYTKDELRDLMGGSIRSKDSSI